MFFSWERARTEPEIAGPPVDFLSLRIPGSASVVLSKLTDQWHQICRRASWSSNSAKPAPCSHAMALPFCWNSLETVYPSVVPVSLATNFSMAACAFRVIKRLLSVVPWRVCRRGHYDFAMSRRSPKSLERPRPVLGRSTKQRSGPSAPKSFCVLNRQLYIRRQRERVVVVKSHVCYLLQPFSAKNDILFVARAPRRQSPPSRAGAGLRLSC
jgi:hypothetical protein